MKKEKVLIISRQPQIYSNQRLAQELAQKSVSFRIIDPESAELTETPALGQIGLLRLASWRFQQALQNLEKLEMPLMNSLDSFLKSRNKWLSLQALAKNNIPTPLTQVLSREEFELIQPSHPFVLKELFSTQGLGVFLIQNKSDLAKALESLPGSDLFIVQQYIKECRGEDLRIFVTSLGDSWSIKRTNHSGDFRSNIHCGGIASAEAASTQELELAFAALEIFDLDYAGIDFLRSPDGPLMIEVNPSPGFEGLESIHGPQVAGPLVDLLLAKIHTKT